MSGGRIVCGIHAVNAALSAGSVRKLWVRRDGRDTEIAERAEDMGVQVSFVSAAALDRKADGAVHQGVVALAAEAERGGWRGRLGRFGQPLVVVLDQVVDPRNLGACLRSAGAFGVDCVVAPKRNAAPLTPTATKAAAGAAESVALERVSNVARELDALRDAGLKIIGTDSGADTDLYSADLRGPVAWVFGGEEDGMRRLVRERCDATVAIPSPSGTGSLNVSVACGICLAETVRQRTAAG